MKILCDECAADSHRCLEVGQMLGDVALPDGWKLAAVQTLVREDWRVVCPACPLPAGSTVVFEDMGIKFEEST